jgi:hypothetical protein
MRCPTGQHILQLGFYFMASPLTPIVPWGLRGAAGFTSPTTLGKTSGNMSRSERIPQRQFPRGAYDCAYTVATYKWTLDRYHQAVAAGLFDDQTLELLRGELVLMPPEGEPYVGTGQLTSDAVKPTAGQ